MDKTGCYFLLNLYYFTHGVFSSPTSGKSENIFSIVGIGLRKD